MATLSNKEAETGDGVVGGGSNTSWAAAQAASGSTNGYTGSTTYLLGYSSNNAGDGNTYWNYRGFYAFDLTSIPAGSTVTAVTIDLYVTAKYSNGGGTTENNSAVLVAGTQASTSSLSNSDFGSKGSTELASRLSYSGLTTSAYNTITLNSAGLTHVQNAIGGFVKFCALSGYDFDGVTPAGGFYSGGVANTANNASNKPRITVTYTVPSRTTSDAWAWSETAAITGRSGDTKYGFSRAASDAWAWSDVAAPYRRSTAQVTVTNEGPNTDLGGGAGTVNLSGASTITVSSTTGFASSGTAYVLDNSTQTQQQAAFTYTGKTSTTFTGCSVSSIIGNPAYGDGNLTFKKTAAVAAPDAESHFPQVTKLDETSTPPLLVSYTQHGGHSVLRGAIKFKISYDGGMTWGSEQSVISSPANGSAYGVFGHLMARLKNGRLVCIWYEHKLDYNVADVIANYWTMMSYSDNSGSSWSTPVELSGCSAYGPRAGFTGFGWMLHTGSGSNATYGDLYVPYAVIDDGIFLHGSGEPYRWYQKLMKITDGGAGGTWTEVGTMATTAQVGGGAVAEGDLTIAANGKWIGHYRVEPSTGQPNYNRWQTESTDNGATWSNPKQVNDGSVVTMLANGAALEKLPNGTLISTGQLSGGSTGSVVSSTSGDNWLAYAKVEATDGTYSVYNGADTEVVINDTSVRVNTAFAYAQERTSQAGARTMFRWYVDPTYSATDAWAWSDTATRSAPKSRTTSDAWAWSDTTYAPAERTASDAWAWSDVAVSVNPVATRSTGDTWTWADAATGALLTPTTYLRTTADSWAWSDAAGPAAAATDATAVERRHRATRRPRRGGEW